MRYLVPELAAVAFFVVTGWAALWPLRKHLGPYIYHVSALPAGLLAAPIAGGVASLSGRPLDAVSSLAGAMLFVGMMWGVARAVPMDSVGAGSGIRVSGFTLMGATTALLAGALGLARYTVSNNDSFMSYWPLAAQLNRTGEFTRAMVASRNALIPSAGSIHAAFGSEWAYVMYPLLAVTLVSWLVLVLIDGPLYGASSRTRMVVAGGTALFLAIEPSFLFHSFFVHSHMASAVYLFMSLACLWIAARTPRNGESAGRPAALLVIAGLFAAGLALARPDGLAYQFVPIAAAISVISGSGALGRRTLTFFAPLCFTVFGVYAAIYAELGLWESSKLDGVTTLAILGVVIVSAAAPSLVRVAERHVPWRLSGERFLLILVGVAAVFTAGVFALRWEAARPALETARINLFEGAGGYHYLWYAALALLVVSVFAGDALRSDSPARPIFLAVVLFFLIAALVHGTSHEGRIGVGDSLNRVMFHVLPVIVWYVGAVVARIVGGPASGERVRP